MTNERPAVITISYMRDRDYVYLHVPKRLVRECGIASGQRFLWFVRDGKLVMEQEVERGNVLMGPGSAKAE